MIQTKDIAWAAGFLEGEGCFRFKKTLKSRPTPTASATQVNKEPLLKLQSIFGLGNIYFHSRSKYSQQDIYSWKVFGTNAIQVMMTVYSLMSERRKLAIKGAIEGWKKAPIANKNKTHCTNKHLYTKENTLHRNGRRICKICDNLGQREKRLRKKLESTEKEEE